MITELNERSRTVFRYIVDSYLNIGAPVGSRTISKKSGLSLSPASIRNIMSDLEYAGLLYSPHTSAGRIPTDQGLRLYIDGLMQISHLSKEEQNKIEATVRSSGKNIEDILEQTSNRLSGLSACASLVMAPKNDSPIEQIQFVKLQPYKILSVLVLQNGMVENRVIETEDDIPPHALTAAANYLNAKLDGKSLSQSKQNIQDDIKNNQTQLDIITQRLVEKGLALPATKGASRIIIRGQSNLLDDVKAIEDLERARALLTYLDEQKNMIDLLGDLDDAQGVQIFIGAENGYFDQSGWSMILSPYKSTDNNIVGAIGVIGPTRLNYDRIIPLVDYTSQMISKIIDDM